MKKVRKSHRTLFSKLAGSPDNGVSTFPFPEEKQFLKMVI